MFLDSNIGSRFIETNKTDNGDDYGNGIAKNTFNILKSTDLSEVDLLYEAEGSGDFDGSGRSLALEMFSPKPFIKVT